MSDKVHSQRGPGDRSRGAHEASDMDARGATFTILGLAGIVLVVGGGVAALYASLGGLASAPAPAPALDAPAPALQVSEARDRGTIEGRARARLAGRDGGVPIDDAMRATARAGWDAPR